MRRAEEPSPPVLVIATTRLAFPVAEAAQQAGYSIETIRLAMRHGDLRASYANSKPVIRASELQRWLDSLPTDPPE